jgi:hypothetical protein
MQLVTRTQPVGALEPAPVTSLCEASHLRAIHDWQGFWDEDRYCVRGQDANGADVWFEIESMAPPDIAPAIVTKSVVQNHMLRKSYAIWAVSRRRRARGKHVPGSFACVFAMKRPLA